MTDPYNRHLADTFEAIVDLVPDKPALIHGDLSRTWREFDDRAARVAQALITGGVGAGDTVAIAMYNGPEWLEAFYGALKCRAVPANVNYRYQNDELAHLLSDSDAAAVVFHTSFIETMMRVRKSLPHVRLWIAVENVPGMTSLPPDIHGFESIIAGHEPASRLPARPVDDCYLSYTGGTTGLPKGVLMNIGRASQPATMFVNIVFGKQFDAGASPIEVARILMEEGLSLKAIPAPPLMHATGLGLTAIPTLAVGGAVITLTSSSFSPHELLETIDRHEANRVTIVGDAFARPVIRAFDEHDRKGLPYSCTSVRVIASAGVAWTASTKAALLNRIPGTVLLDACGAAEGVTYGTKIARKGDDMETGNFDPTPGLLLVDADGAILPARPGQVGLIASPPLASGYRNDPVKSAETYRMLNGELYAIPGDYGEFKPDGSFMLLGRGTTVINTGGEKVYPEEIEDAIKELPHVEDCLVLGMPDEVFGQRVTALVQLGPTSRQDGAHIIDHTKARLAGYKSPRSVILVSAIPRGPNGKADYVEARKIAEETPSI